MRNIENSSLGQRLNYARLTAHERRREHTKITQSELAEAMGDLSKSYISQIETGKYETPDLKFSHIINAAKYLMCDPIWLAYGKGELEDCDKDLELTYKIPLFRPLALMDENPKPADHLYLRKSLYEQLGKNPYATVVTDNCMKGDASQGDVVIIDPDRQMQAKNLVLVKAPGESQPLLRRYRFNHSSGNLVLASNDEELPWLNPDDCKILGVAVQIQRELIAPLTHLVTPNNVIPLHPQKAS
ncbi:helix-turn-helix domain-containing protein [Endozoicomonas sp. Mp262]|uniref:helix-turn-helix domain-containing protein n=1 Tax=Endozoicomonas sp. Mp262 TaxID=2919499 RepID=UPI0021DB639A